MAGGTTVFHRTINSKASLGRHEQKQQQHQKQNPFEGKTLGLLLQKDSCFQNQLDTADFLIDGANIREAMREISLDIKEGADMIMVKPAMPYLDVISEARRRFDLPIAAYQVSGEYSMLQAAIRNGWLDRDRVIMESLTSIRRAGAQLILTYFAKDAARMLIP